MTDYVITNVRILDGTGREPFPGAVRVEGNRIAEVTPGAAPAVNGATRIDGPERRSCRASSSRTRTSVWPTWAPTI